MMLDASMIENEIGTGPGFSYSAQYGVRRASTRPDVYRTQFGSMSADEYLTPIPSSHRRSDGNIARRLSRNSFIIPPQAFLRRATEGTSLFNDGRDSVISLSTCDQPDQSSISSLIISASNEEQFENEMSFR